MNLNESTTSLHMWYLLVSRLRRVLALLVQTSYSCLRQGVLRLNNKTLISLFFLSFVMIVLYSQAQLEIYNRHLSTDLSVFLNRSSYFINHLSLNGLEGNEYQPGATTLFILLSPALLFGNPSDSFRIVFFITNLLLVIGLAYFYNQVAKENNLLFALLLLFTGPIILFRFDLLVAFFVVASIVLWNKKHIIPSIILLAIATTIKIYPLIFLPYLLITTYKNFGIKSASKILAVFVAIITIFVFFFSFFFQASLQQTLNGLFYHSAKPVSTDNLLGSIIYFLNLIQSGQHIPIISSYGTNGFANENIILPLEFYNYVWLIPFILLHILLLRKKIYSYKIDVIFYLTNLLFFLIFTKSMAPQYMIWFITLLPLLNPNFYLTNRWVIAIIAICASLFFYQFIYPLKYDLWLSAFYPPYNFHGLLLVNILRNLLLIGVALKLLTALAKKPEPSE